ncbi:MAG: polysialyltransferase family glycosyltransferase [Patescibacteria group bacterium]|nr:hypothetical protein [Patescibacteria group bacterium]
MSTKILVVSHDAGGANILASYVKKHEKEYGFICYVEGPAKEIFRKNKIKYKLAESKAVSKENPDVVLTGTSGSSMVELDFINAAKKEGIKTVSYLDHWVNHKQRFRFPEKGWEENLPDEIWAGDKYCYEDAKELFPNQTVKFVKNPYFEEIKRKYKALKKGSKNTVLFISEPVNIGNKDNFSSVTEYDVLDSCLAYLKKRKIIVRLHPSEPKTKYEKILSKYPEKNILKSHQKLEEDFARSSLVIGMESTALVLAHICGKKVICMPPKRSKKFLLPYKIKKLKNLKNLKNFIS